MTNNQNLARWDVVLLGGFMHSVAARVSSELQSSIRRSYGLSVLVSVTPPGCPRPHLPATSTLQFIVSPVIGSLSDSYGRKTILLWTMAGNVLSAAVYVFNVFFQSARSSNSLPYDSWIKSTTWASYLLSRAIGGISEG